MSNSGNPAVPEMHSAQNSEGDDQGEAQRRQSSNAPADNTTSSGDDNSEHEEDEEGDDASDDEEEEEEDEEPKLRYNRIKSSVAETLAKDAASVLRVSMRFVVSYPDHGHHHWVNSTLTYLMQAMGTHWGAVHILDFDGNLIKSWQNHSATVNDISIDEAEDFVATASDDGRQTSAAVTVRICFNRDGVY